MRGAAYGVLLAVLLTLAPASAIEKDACIDAHADAQKLQRAGRFRDASKAVAICLNASCPSAVRVECGDFATRLSGAQPGIVLEVDEPARVSRVALDGVALDVATLSRTLDVDPGEHVVVVTTVDGAVQRRVFFAREGESRKTIQLRVARETPRADTRAPAKGPLPTASVILFGVGAVGVVSSAGFGTLALTKGARVEARCGDTRTCPQTEVDAMQRNALVADVTAVVGLVALGVGAVLAVTTGGRREADVR